MLSEQQILNEIYGSGNLSVQQILNRVHEAGWRPENLFTVGAVACDYTSVQAAVDAAIDAGCSAEHPCEVLIGPGVFTESVVFGCTKGQLVEGLSIRGAGRGVTIIKSSGLTNNTAALTIGYNAMHISVADLTLEQNGSSRCMIMGKRDPLDDDALLYTMYVDLSVEFSWSSGGAIEGFGHEVEYRDCAFHGLASGIMKDILVCRGDEAINWVAMNGSTFTPYNDPATSRFKTAASWIWTSGPAGPGDVAYCNLPAAKEILAGEQGHDAIEFMLKKSDGTLPDGTTLKIMSGTNGTGNVLGTATLDSNTANWTQRRVPLTDVVAGTARSVLLCLPLEVTNTLSYRLCDMWIVRTLYRDHNFVALDNWAPSYGASGWTTISGVAIIRNYSIDASFRYQVLGFAQEFALGTSEVLFINGLRVLLRSASNNDVEAFRIGGSTTAYINGVNGEIDHSDASAGGRAWFANNAGGSVMLGCNPIDFGTAFGTATWAEIHELVSRLSNKIQIKSKLTSHTIADLTALANYTALEGAFVYDLTNHALMVHTGAAWKTVTIA